MKMIKWRRCRNYAFIFLIPLLYAHIFLFGVNDQSTSCSSPLIRVMLFKLSAGIQNIYLEQKIGRNRLSLSPQLHLYKELMDLASAETFNHKHLKRKCSPQLAKKLHHSVSFIDVKKNLLAGNIKNIYKEKIPGNRNKKYPKKAKVKRDKDREDELILVNPFHFLPGYHCFKDKNLSLFAKVEAFYAAIILGDRPLIEKTHKNLAESLKNKSDRVFYSGLCQLTTMILEQNDPWLSTNEIDSEILAYYFLLTGDFHTPIRIKSSQKKKYQEVMEYFKKEIYEDVLIEVNRYLLDNKVFLWLGAREALNHNDYNLANSCLKSTFGQGVLDNFRPDDKAYFYSTLQLALKMDNKEFLTYVYTGLKHLTAHLERGGINELYKIINKIRYH